MKIDEMRLPEKVTYTLPPCNASNMKVVTKLFSESLGGDNLLETEQLNVPLSIVSNILYVVAWIYNRYIILRRGTLLLFLFLFLHTNA